jgi:hypothetical protein
MARSIGVHALLLAAVFSLSACCTHEPAQNTALYQGTGDGSIHDPGRPAVLASGIGSGAVPSAEASVLLSS